MSIIGNYIRYKDVLLFHSFTKEIIWHGFQKVDCVTSAQSCRLAAIA